MFYVMKAKQFKKISREFIKLQIALDSWNEIQKSVIKKSDLNLIIWIACPVFLFITYFVLIFVINQLNGDDILVSWPMVLDVISVDLDNI